MSIAKSSPRIPETAFAVSGMFHFLRIMGLEPIPRERQEPKSCVSANSTISAQFLIEKTSLNIKPVSNVREKIRTPGLLIRSQTLYPAELHALILPYLWATAGNRNRTGTSVATRRILSPVRLPVPPCRHGSCMRPTTRMGLEPTTSAVTGRRSNQLSHRASLHLQNCTPKSF